MPAAQRCNHGELIVQVTTYGRGFSGKRTQPGRMGIGADLYPRIGGTSAPPRTAPHRIPKKSVATLLGEMPDGVFQAESSTTAISAQPTPANCRRVMDS